MSENIDVKSTNLRHSQSDEIETGVSNFDVDWLFRSKHQKNLNKKNNKSKGLLDDRVADGIKSPSGASTPVPEPPKITISTEQFPNNELISPKTQVNGSIEEKKSSGRSRSVSASIVETKSAYIPADPIPRRGSLPATNQPPATTPAATSTTRRLFGSISSKFKSSANSSPKSSPTSSPKVTHAKLNSPQASKPIKLKDDLVSNVNKPPAGSGIPVAGTTAATPTKRRTSFKSNGTSGLFKESYTTKEDSPTTSGKSSFFRRRSSVNSLNVPPPQQTPKRIVLNKNLNKKSIPIKELQDVNLKRVTFAIDKLEYDPQQQIPSRRPKRGNVIIPQDIAAPLPRLCQGIAMNEPNGKDQQQQKSSYSEQEINLALEAQKRALQMAEKHAQDAYAQAKKMAQEVASFKPSKLSTLKERKQEQDEDEQELKLLLKAAHVDIDKPLHVHEQHFAKEVHDSKQGITLEMIYTRCCHLREILPIPATLKQLTNKTAPLQVLKFLNPKPTLIDVLSFSDFISIAPIYTVIFDNVTMTDEMLKHFLGSLAYNKSLEKLSLRNVAINKQGWKYLCKFLARNVTVKKLDISQQQKSKIELDSSLIRANMNWDLFIEAIGLRGGIEELVINGCKLSDETFAKLINKAVKKSTRRLGIAGIDLNVYKAQVVCDWLTDRESKCVGVDIASNDLSKGQLKPFINAFNQGIDNFIFFSLNSTHLIDLEHAKELIKSLTNVKTLRFLDLSSMPQIFPGIISTLAKYLPKYPNLRRIHFDFNELTSKAIGSIAAFISKVPKLVHVSLMGNRDLSPAAVFTLYTAVKSSNTLHALDLDYDLVSEELASRIAFYLMRNMDLSLKPEYFAGNVEVNQEDLMFDGSLLMETAEKLLIEVDKGGKQEEDDAKIQQIITDTIIERTRAIRKDIHDTIDKLFELRKAGELSFEGKETLVRFCLLDASLEKLVHMFDEHGPISVAVTPTSEQVPVITEKPPLSRVGSGWKLSSLGVDHLHESSSELLTAGPILSAHNINNSLNTADYFSSPLASNSEEQSLHPHSVVVETDNGKDVAVDRTTGRPVLFRSLSQTLLSAKEQELEEGEFLRLGVFMQSRKNPETAPSSSVTEDTSRKSSTDDSKGSGFPLLSGLPSGSELRQAIMSAKGIRNVTELIDKINTNRVSLEKLIPGGEEQRTIESEDSKLTNIEEDEDTINTSGSSSNSKEDEPSVDPKVDEVYDKLLNDAEQRQRKKKIHHV
ncbi:GLC7-interacting protein 3 [Spathaspora sp. JA1]|nr:GLC7-interacting protein 3 [Spathaspora sp. JA1]